MGLARIEQRVSGTVDGSNKVFETGFEYQAGTLVVFRNGEALEASADNGWTELGGKQFEMKVAPLGGTNPDVIGAYYVIR